ncbi:MAG TPA: hypothetical protein VGA89_00295 [Patescibacteria group bacterium]|jgi:hypothetical protein
MKQAQFLAKLVEEARLQAQISSASIMPKRLAKVALIIGRHTWKVLLVVSGFLSLLTEVW